MKAFSAILILFFVAAALGLKLNVDHEKRRVCIAELRCWLIQYLGYKWLEEEVNDS
jgi:hypothetical protein